MLVVFEVYFAPGTDPNTLLSEEVKRENKAKLMTFAEAEAFGFGGLPSPQSRGEARIVSVAKPDAAWINRVLETSEIVAGFRVHEVG